MYKSRSKLKHLRETAPRTPRPASRALAQTRPALVTNTCREMCSPQTAVRHDWLAESGWADRQVRRMTRTRLWMIIII